MTLKISRRAYAEMFGPTTGDRIRLADTDLLIEIERDFSSYFRIASTMLQAARLHEIAASSGASMADVFDVVNAFDAIGLIEWQPRTPRGGEPVEEPKSGLFQRLRKSLKR